MPLAIKGGVRVTEYWDLTMGEIQVVLDALSQTIKENIARNYNLATMIAMFTRATFSGKDIPSIETLYPKVFKEQQEEETNDCGWMRFKEEFTDYSNKFNQMRRDNDPRRTEHKDNSGDEFASERDSASRISDEADEQYR